MKITCGREDLIKALSITEKMTGVNVTLPILSCVLLIVKDDILTIRSTNIELGVEVVLSVTSEEDGIVAVPANIFYSIIQNTYDQRINIETKKETLIINTKHSKTILNTQPYGDFPSLPKVKSDVKYILKSEHLIKGIESVVYSASHSTIKAELSSVYIYEEDKKLYFVSTDSFRLAEKKNTDKK